MGARHHHTPHAMELDAGACLGPSRLTPSDAAGLLSAPGVRYRRGGRPCGWSPVPRRDAADGGGCADRTRFPVACAPPRAGGRVCLTHQTAKEQASTWDPGTAGPHRTARGTSRGPRPRAHPSHPPQVPGHLGRVDPRGRAGTGAAWAWAKPSAGARVSPRVPCVAGAAGAPGRHGLAEGCGVCARRGADGAGHGVGLGSARPSGCLRGPGRGAADRGLVPSHAGWASGWQEEPQAGHHAPPAPNQAVEPTAPMIALWQAGVVQGAAAHRGR